MASNSSSAAIGIDLGTTNSVLAHYHKDRAEIITNQQGESITQSIVCFMDNGEISVGTRGRRIAPKNEIYGVKRFIGQNFSRIKAELNKLPYSVTCGIKDTPIINIPNGQTRRVTQKTAEDISGLVLKKLSDAARDRLAGTYNNKAVITVPAYFNYSQRVATKEAAKKANLQVLALLNEPTAAALQYMFDVGPKAVNKTVLVYDFGGGTFDISIIKISNQNTLSVQAIDGDAHLGGMDIDQTIFKLVTDRIKSKHQLDLSNLLADPNNIKKLTLYSRLLNECETIKKHLSFNMEADWFLAPVDTIEEVDFRFQRHEIENAIRPIISRTITIIQDCLRKSNKKKEDFDEVLLIGGSSRIPLIHQMLKDFFGEGKIRKTQNLDQTVALGAAIYAAKLNENPTALQKFHLNDVLSFSLGTDIEDDKMSFILRKNERLPASKTKQYKTLEDNQDSMLIRIFEGEAAKFTDNRLLGEFNIEGIDKAPAGQVKVSVTFCVDVDGILHISASDQFHNATKELTITLA